ncbi:MAG: NAD-dependent epimerase/dehydratase family protein [Candidatus Heimdallarchaeota archaeon]|nr:NAD-dependent epimerase/dehydratase family protein [Candidatus Heimdallarchaeota archaeon]
MTRILMTGSLGQIGTELIALLRTKYGKENVIGTDLESPNEELEDLGPYQRLDVTDHTAIATAVELYNVDWLVHNASLLSASGERNPRLAMDVNIRGFEYAIEAAKEYNLRILTPSSMAAFGPSTPRLNTPDVTIMRPNTIYGVSKVYIELLGEYYHSKWGVDFRSLRYPGIISSGIMPEGGTTDYAVDIFYEALKQKTYECFLKPDATLPMMYMPDCLKGTLQLLEADNANLISRVFNVAAFSFSPGEIAAEIQIHIPDFEITYNPDFRQILAESWPQSLSDTNARAQWNWMPDYTLSMMVEDMLEKLAAKLEIEYLSGSE